MVEAFDQEPTDNAIPEEPPPKPANALAGIRRDLTDEELSSPGARKLLIDRLDKTETLVVELQGYCDKFHESDKDVARLNERLRQVNASELLYGFALAAGALLVGLSPAAWDCQPFGSLSLLLGVALMIGAVISKGMRQ